MYGTSSESGEDASGPPQCPACKGKTYFVDPEQTVMTCYDCGRYFRRKKPEAGEAAAAPPPPATPEPPAPEPQAPEVYAPPPPAVPKAPASRPTVPEPPVYTPQPPPPPAPPEAPPPVMVEPERPALEVEPVAAEASEGTGDFDLMIGDVDAAPVPEAPPHATIEVGETVHCSVCGFPMDGDWKVCPNCVSRYETTCAGCGKTLSAWWLICPWCERPKHPDHIHVAKG